MSMQNRSKLNRLLLSYPKGAVYTSAWLNQQGFSRVLIDRYKKSNWLSLIARGAYTISGDNVDWTGGLYAIQSQLKLKIHAGSKTALQLHGVAHYLPEEIKKLYLFGAEGVKLPSWFKKNTWNLDFKYFTTNLFDKEIGLSTRDCGNFSIKISSPERAIMETLYLVPRQQTFEEASLLMENLITLRPALVTDLLANANSIKVKRLFMYLAEKHKSPWFEQLDPVGINMGKGKRVIVKGGVLDKKYQIIVPNN